MEWKKLVKFTKSDYVFLGVVALAFWIILGVYWLYTTMYIVSKSWEVGANAWIFGILTLVTNLFGVACLWIYIKWHLVCLECRKIQPRNVNNCALCGTAIYVKCPDCGRRISVKDLFCNGCGRKMHDEADSIKYGYTAEQKIVMSVGLTIERKGISDFVELAKRMPEYQFVWFGETNLNTVPVKTRKAVRTKLPNLWFAGYVNPEELREAYGSCDLFLFPSKEETEGIVVLEALAMKIPILLRDIPVYGDWLAENKEVYKAKDIKDFEQKARKILEGKLPDLTETGYRVAEDRSIEKVGIKLGEIYRKITET